MADVGLGRWTPPISRWSLNDKVFIYLKDGRVAGPCLIVNIHAPRDRFGRWRYDIQDWSGTIKTNISGSILSDPIVAIGLTVWFDAFSRHGTFHPLNPQHFKIEAFRHDPKKDSKEGPCWIVFARPPTPSGRVAEVYRTADVSWKQHWTFSLQEAEPEGDNAPILHIAAFQSMPSSDGFDVVESIEPVNPPSSKAQISANLQGTRGAVAVMVRTNDANLDIHLDLEFVGKKRMLSTENIRARGSASTNFLVGGSAPSNPILSDIPAILWAARTGWNDGLQTLLAKSAEDEHIRDSDGRTALSWAAGNGKVETVELLLPETVNPLLSKRVEPLLSEIPEPLLSQTDLHMPDNKKRSPLSWAAENGHDSVVQLLLNAGASIAEQSPDAEGHTPISRAARNSHGSVLHILVTDVKKRCGVNFDGLRDFVSSNLLKAAEEGWLDFVQILLGTNVLRNPVTDYRAPVCLAASNGHKRIVEMLLLAKADPNSELSGDTALYLSVQAGHDDVAKALLESGASTRKPNASGILDDLVRENRTMYAMLRAADTEGQLAESDGDTRPDTDDKFIATVSSFKIDRKATQFQPIALSVKSLLKDPWGTMGNEQSSFQWIHLPANNMRWVELLLARLYDGTNRAYQVLKPERWVRRQHHGASGEPYTRFMRPLCQLFESTSRVATHFEEYQHAPYTHQSDLVVLMPFLHWDINGRRIDRLQAWKSRNQVLNPASSERFGTPHKPIFVMDSQESAQIQLVQNYLNNTSHAYHYLHIRRTLDQYYYHALTDTTERDNSQVLTRYQKTHKTRESHFQAITMVDQLWLWVLNGSDGRPGIVVSCFPSVGDLGTSNENYHPDPYHDTDVLDNIKRYIRADSGCIRTPYDLAGVIAAVCSRNYLDPGTTLHLDHEFKDADVQFADVYESAIGDIMENETISFAKFKELPTDQVADIENEIHSLYEAKDVLDELNIMSVLFQDEKRVLQALEKAVQSFDDDHDLFFSTGGGAQSLQRESTNDEMMDSSAHPREGNEPGNDDLSNAKPLMTKHKGDLQNELTNSSSRGRRNIGSIWGRGTDTRVSSLPIELVNTSIEDINGMIERAKQARKALNFLVDLKFKHNNVIDSKKSLSMSQKTAELTEQIKRSEEQSLDLATKTAALTGKITESTEATKESVSKTQKLTEETTELAVKADKEGRTVMVFTIVTIIFLPLSFMATMFQLPIDQYKRTGDMLDLGYVSKIMFPISTLISAILIWIAFKAEKVENLLKGKKGTPGAEVALVKTRTSGAPCPTEPIKGDEVV